MSTTHLIAINGDFLQLVREAPETFAMALADACSRSGNIPSDHVLSDHFKVHYVTSDMGGVRGAITRAWMDHI